MKSGFQTVVLLVALAALGGCQSVKQELGVGRNSPDEFTVVKRAPLSLPPDYGLRPPADGTVPAATGTVNAAKSVVLGEQAVLKSETAPAGGADSLFLQKAGADKADPNVRVEINKENGLIAVENKNIGEKLIFWKAEGNPDENVPASVVDPKREIQRIEKNKEEGKPVNEGNVPVIERKQSTIDKLF